MHHRFARNAENIDKVSESVAEHPNVPIPNRSQELWLSYGTLWRILHSDLYLQPCKVKHMQQLKPGDHSQHRRYVEWVLEQQTEDGNFSNKIFFCDKAHFTHGGYVNKQNCLEERPLYTEKFTIWCALWFEGMIGPYFFENDDGMTVNVNSERYDHMIINFF